MDSIFYLLKGFEAIITPYGLLICFLGVLAGTLVGVLPGFGPTAGMALLLPISYHMDPTLAIVLLAGIYYGAMYGGSTTSILMNIPGEAASVVTCIDGYHMALKGRAGPALAIAAIGSFIAGTGGVIFLSFFSKPLSEYGLLMGPPEFFSLFVAAIILLTYLSFKSTVKSLIMAVFGLILGTVGIDVFAGTPRFTFNMINLYQGIEFVPVVMGLFGISEVLINIETELKQEIFVEKISKILPSYKEYKRSIVPIFRGGLIGFLLGIIPGGGAIIASFISYTIEKKFAKAEFKEEFGKGAIEGVAGPESANNAAAVGAFIPLLSLGIPSNAVTAILLGALMMHQVIPGPNLINEHPEIFWGVIASMYIGNVFLLILNLPLVGMWVKILKIPYLILFPLIIIFCIVGVHSLNNNIFDIYVMIIFGGLGYILKKFDFDLAPCVLAMVLGPLFEEAFRRSLIISGGNIFIFFNRPISLIFLAISALFLLSTIVPKLAEFRKKMSA